MVDAADARVKAADEQKARAEAALIQQKWPGATPSPKGARVQITREGRGEPAAAGQTLMVRYTGQFLDGRPIASSDEEGRPVPGSAAKPFTYVVGKSRINPALDEALAAMRAGETRTVIAAGQLGYGRSGYTSPQKPGEKRFVISPNTTLVYEVELLEIKR
jgi:FKBP-type peptidyl-prolyl cis-trans isomerase